jgi:hypothetical protein
MKEIIGFGLTIKTSHNMGFTKSLVGQSNLQQLYATQLWFRAGQAILGINSYLQLNKKSAAVPGGRNTNSKPSVSPAR